MAYRLEVLSIWTKIMSCGQDLNCFLSLFQYCLTANKSVIASGSSDSTVRVWSYAGMILLNPLPDNKILDWSKLKQIADDILKCI